MHVCIYPGSTIIEVLAKVNKHVTIYISETCTGTTNRWEFNGMCIGLVLIGNAAPEVIIEIVSFV